MCRCEPHFGEAISSLAGGLLRASFDFAEFILSKAKGSAQNALAMTGGYCKFSKIAAAPMPPPMHMDTMPYFDLRRAIS